MAAADKARKILEVGWQRRLQVGQLGFRQVVVLHCCVVGLMAVAAAAYLEVRLMFLYLRNSSGLASLPEGLQGIVSNDKGQAWQCGSIFRVLYHVSEA